MKQKYSNAKDKFKGLMRQRSGQIALAAPEPTRRSSQEPATTNDRGISTAPSAIVLESQAGNAPDANTMPSDDAPALEAPKPEPSPQPKQTSNVSATDTQQTFEPPVPASMASACDDLLMVVRGAPDRYPLLKSALGGILEIWKECDVRHQLLYNVFSLFDWRFRFLQRPKTSLKGSKASFKWKH